MNNNPFKIVEMFEEEMAEYTGAPYAISCDSCTNAIFLACKYLGAEDKTITIPARTYLSIPQTILNAGARLEFEDISWKGIYQLKPLPVYDAAKRLTSGMYMSGSYMCLSFHIKKHLPIGKGGMILTDDPDCVDIIKRMRYEGRGPLSYHNDDITMAGWNMYMTPEEAARGLTLMMDYPETVDDQIESPDYRDLRSFKYFNLLK